MTVIGPTAYIGAENHPRGTAAAFDRVTGHIRIPRSDRHGLETERVYNFSSLGFRGSEYEPAAALRLFVCGCSYTFGMGVGIERTWPVVFTRLAAAELGVPVEKCNVQNFSQIGASNN